MKQAAVKKHDAKQNARRAEKARIAEEMKKAEKEAALRRLEADIKLKEMQRLATEASRMKPKSL